MHTIRTILSGLSLLTLLGTSTHVFSQTVIDWTAGDSSDYYGSVFNWDGLNVPNTTTESARFNLAGSYNVTIASGLTTQVSDLIIQQGDINFASNGAVFATYTTADDLILNGGDLTISRTGGSGNVRLSVGDEINVTSDSSLFVDNGSDIVTVNLFAGRSAGGDGYVEFDGTGSTLEVTGSVILGSSGRTGTLVFQNASTGNTIAGTTTLVSGSNVNSEGFLSVLSGTGLTAGNLRVGSLSTAASAVQQAVVTVNGTGSVLSQTGASTLTVGDATNSDVRSDLLIQQSGTMTTGTGDILIQNSGLIDITNAGVFNANGNITLDGGTLERSTDSQFNLSSGLTLTAQNNAEITITGAYNLNNNTTFNIESGSDLFISSTLIGDVTTGGMTVDGTGTDFSSLTSSLISVGSNSGTGSLTYSNNATGTHGQVRVGNVNDPDPNTSGTFNVESGASLTIDELYINNAGGLNASGEVTVTGTGSSITQTPFASANIGHTSSGTGTLTIQDSATFTTGQGTTSILPTGTLNIDLDSSGGSFQANGPVIVEGGTINKVSSALQINPGAYLLVRNGGAMFTTGGEYTDPNASYLVQEPGSLISNDNILFIVDNASYNVTLGGTLSVDTGIQMFDSSTMLVSGIGSTLDNNGSLDVGQAAGSPTATFADGATADTNGLTLATGPSPTDTINATVNVTTGATLNTGFGDILLTSNGGPFKSSTLNIQGPGSLVTQHPTAGGSIVVGDDLNGTATINIATTQSGATLTTTANGVKQFNIKATGTVNIGSPTTTGTLNNSLDFTNEGLINIAGGTLNNTASQFLNTGNGTIRGSGTIDMNINTLTNDATVSPGITTGAPTTAGVMTIADGHFTQQANGILEIEIGGTTPGSEHDVLDVGRNLTLAGTLDVSFINGYTPQIGDSFDILNWGISVFGDFDTRNLPALGAGMLWDQTNLLTDGTLAIISDALTGDLNGDGFVGIADLNIVLGAWNQSVPPADPAADPSGDNFVGIADLNTVLGNWNAGTPPNNMDTNVPEPASFTVLMIAYLCLLRHPRLQPEL